MSPESLQPAAVSNIIKRDGTIVPFDLIKITNAIRKAMKAAGEGDDQAADKGARVVLVELEKKAALASGKDYLPGVEEIQDIVEKALILSQFPLVAKAYILYRERR